VRCRIEAVTAHNFAVAARRHNNLVDTESSPVLDCLIGDIILQAKGPKLVSPNYASITA
jgi:hypothetical protein